MANFYPYLVSTLPTLSFGASAPFTCEQFLQRCSELISDKDMMALRCVTQSGGTDNPVIRKWQAFCVLLHNELVKVRAVRKKVSAEKYLRADGNPDPGFTHLALAAYRNPSQLEGERLLDMAKWNFLEEMSLGHYFDLESIIIYAYKLLILERWERINAADNEMLLRSV